MFKKAVQQGRSKRGGEAYSGLYVEPPSDARTRLAAFFNILLELPADGEEHALPPGIVNIERLTGGRPIRTERFDGARPRSNVPILIAGFQQQSPPRSDDDRSLRLHALAAGRRRQEARVLRQIRSQMVNVLAAVVRDGYIEDAAFDRKKREDGHGTSDPEA